MESDEKCFDCVSNCLSHELNSLNELGTQFKEYLNNKQNSNANQSCYDTISLSLTQMKENLIQINKKEKINKILIQDLLNKYVYDINVQISQNIMHMFKIERDTIAPSQTKPGMAVHLNVY